MTFEFMLTAAINILTAGIVIGMYRQQVTHHGERFKHHDERLQELNREKLDKAVHEVEVVRLDSEIRTVSHRVSGIDQRLHGVETKR